jgi:hypothetical protein
MVSCRAARTDQRSHHIAHVDVDVDADADADRMEMEMEMEEVMQVR